MDFKKDISRQGQLAVGRGSWQGQLAGAVGSKQGQLAVKSELIKFYWSGDGKKKYK